MRRGRTAVAGRTSATGRARVAALRKGIVIGRSCALLHGPASAAEAMAARQAGYRTAPDARPVVGSPSPRAGGPLLTPGTYTDTVSVGDRKFYRVRLDGRSNAYVSAVLAPPPGSRAGATDGIRVSLVSPDGAECSDSNDIVFGTATPLPTADYSTRRIGPGRACQEAGDYLYSVEWIGPTGGAAPRDWRVEIKYMTEPGLRTGSPTPAPPSSRHTHTPDHIPGPERRVEGGSGFNDAARLGHGVWADRLGPGESRFYRVPVDWGQQLFVDARFTGAVAPRRPVYDGVRVTVFNTARGFVENTARAHRTATTRLSLATEPAAFANRTSDRDATSGMRFSGWYYLRVSADRKIPGELPVTLAVGIEGEPHPAPPYAGDPLREGFGVLAEDRAQPPPADQQAAPQDDDDTRELVLTVIGVTGITLGTTLLLGLLAWTALARLGLGRKRGRHAS
ncbi:hypothetical protein [Streptomyces clavuligerus]|uniref:hypothetical protein n=1 Tax=Streptomyces clavuligerus TaxID=1901 RepID=UPI0018CFFC56|nr:hypothetical protein [Streptomyces clavuligerus]